MKTRAVRRGRRGRGGQQGHEQRTRIRTRELRAVELTTQGWSQPEIAAELGVSQAAVSKILQRADARALRDLTAVVAQQKARQTVHLQYVCRESIRAWELSKADTTRRRQRKTQSGGSGPGATVAEIVVETQHGDPRYLQVARIALADLRKLWGLDAPLHVDLRTQSPYDDMTQEALEAEIARQARLLEGRGPATPVREEPTDGH